MIDIAPDVTPSHCPQCLKSASLCQCAEITAFDNKIFVLILQHPQEQDREIGTARLAASHFRHAKVLVGLSWPNLTKALGRNADPKKWGVLYLGPVRLSAEATKQPVVVLDRNGTPSLILRQRFPILRELFYSTARGAKPRLYGGAMRGC